MNINTGQSLFAKKKYLSAGPLVKKKKIYNHSALKSGDIVQALLEARMNLTLFL